MYYIRHDLKNTERFTMEHFSAANTTAQTFKRIFVIEKSKIFPILDKTDNAHARPTYTDKPYSEPNLPSKIKITNGQLNTQNKQIYRQRTPMLPIPPKPPFNPI